MALSGVQEGKARPAGACGGWEGRLTEALGVGRGRRGAAGTTGTDDSDAEGVAPDVGREE